MAKMNKNDLLTYRNAAEANSIHASDELNASNKRAYDYYCGNPLGNEVDGESQVISTDVFDLVEADMPSLVRVFLGANDIMKFSPIMDTEAERATSEEKTKYINQLIRNQPESYKTIYDVLKGAEIYRYSAVTYGYEEKETVKVVEYEGLTEEELAEVTIELQLLEQDGAEIDIQDVKRPNLDKFKDIRATIKRKVGKYFSRYIDPERFVISKGAENEEDAELIGHDDIVTKSDLVAMGYDKDIVKNLDTTNGSDNTNEQNRLIDQGGIKEGNGLSWVGELVKLETRYVKVDQDLDGIAERVCIISVGQTILDDFPYEIAPYAVFCSNMMPGQLIGKSRADAVMETQDIKSTLLRQTMMNMYQVNSARMMINDNVNMDDLLTQRIGGIVRVSGDTNPLQNAAPLPTPFIGDKALMVLQYADSARAQRTGSLMANQALDSDRLGKETATRFEGMKDASVSKIELVARGHAETGFKRWFSGMLWTVVHYQKEKTEIMVLGKALTVDPRRWLSEQPIIANVGLGAGDDDSIMENMSSLLSVSQQLIAQGSPLTDMSKQYNILSRITKAMNQSDVGEFFNNPQQPKEMLQAQVEQLQRKNQQLEQQVQTNPLAEAEEVRAQASLVKAQATQELNIAKLQEEQRQFSLKMQSEQQRFNDESMAKANKVIADLEAKYTEMELKYNTDVPGQGMGE
jgi:hypothetical protein